MTLEQQSQQRQVTPVHCGRDELNLIDFPISTLQYQQPLNREGKLPDEVVCTVEQYDADLDDVVPRKLTKRTASKYGFPTPLEDEVLVGLLTLTRIKNNFQEPRISFRNGELYELMGWPPNNKSNERLSTALDRLTGLTLKYENSWTIEDGTFQKEFTTGLLDSYKFVQQTRGTRVRDREQSWIQWASEVFADIQNGNVKELNTDEFFSLDRPISQRMYRFLDKHLSLAPHFEIDLITLAEHLGVSETRHIGKIKERLAPGIDELERLGTFIQPVERETRYHKRGPGQWLIQFDRVAFLKQIPEKAPLAAKDNVVIDDKPSRLVREFSEAFLGFEPSRITKNAIEHAAQLIHRYGAEQLFEKVPKVARLMKQNFPNARTFGASIGYFDEVLAKAHKAEHRMGVEQQASIKEKNDKPQSEIHRRRRQLFRSRWRTLPESQRQDILSVVAKNGCETLRSFITQGKDNDPLVEIACMDELERRIEVEKAM